MDTRELIDKFLENRNQRLKEIATLLQQSIVHAKSVNADSTIVEFFVTKEEATNLKYYFTKEKKKSLGITNNFKVENNRYPIRIIRKTFEKYLQDNKLTDQVKNNDTNTTQPVVQETNTSIEELIQQVGLTINSDASPEIVYSNMTQPTLYGYEAQYVTQQSDTTSTYLYNYGTHYETQHSYPTSTNLGGYEVQYATQERYPTFTETPVGNNIPLINHEQLALELGIVDEYRKSCLESGQTDSRPQHFERTDNYELYFSTFNNPNQSEKNIKSTTNEDNNNNNSKSTHSDKIRQELNPSERANDSIDPEQTESESDNDKIIDNNETHSDNESEPEIIISYVIETRLFDIQNQNRHFSKNDITYVSEKPATSNAENNEIVDNNETVNSKSEPAIITCTVIGTRLLDEQNQNQNHNFPNDATTYVSVGPATSNAENNEIIDNSETHNDNESQPKIIEFFRKKIQEGKKEGNYVCMFLTEDEADWLKPIMEKDFVRFTGKFGIVSKITKVKNQRCYSLTVVPKTFNRNFPEQQQNLPTNSASIESNEHAQQLNANNKRSSQSIFTNNLDKRSKSIGTNNANGVPNSTPTYSSPYPTLNAYSSIPANEGFNSPDGLLTIYEHTKVSNATTPAVETNSNLPLENSLRQEAVIQEKLPQQEVVTPVTVIEPASSGTSDEIIEAVIQEKLPQQEVVTPITASEPASSGVNNEIIEAVIQEKLPQQEVVTPVMAVAPANSTASGEIIDKDPQTVRKKEDELVTQGELDEIQRVNQEEICEKIDEETHNNNNSAHRKRKRNIDNKPKRTNKGKHAKNSPRDPASLESNQSPNQSDIKNPFNDTNHLVERLRAEIKEQQAHLVGNTSGRISKDRFYIYIEKKDGEQIRDVLNRKKSLKTDLGIVNIGPVDNVKFKVSFDKELSKFTEFETKLKSMSTTPKSTIENNNEANVECLTIDAGTHEADVEESGMSNKLDDETNNNNNSAHRKNDKKNPFNDTDHLVKYLRGRIHQRQNELANSTSGRISKNSICISISIKDGRQIRDVLDRKKSLKTDLGIKKAVANGYKKFTVSFDKELSKFTEFETKLKSMSTTPKSTIENNNEANVECLTIDAGTHEADVEESGMSINLPELFPFSNEHELSSSRGSIFFHSENELSFQKLTSDHKDEKEWTDFIEKLPSAPSTNSMNNNIKTDIQVSDKSLNDPEKITPSASLG